jgi:hypothetical protein
MIIEIKCKTCKKLYTVVVEQADYDTWQSDGRTGGPKRHIQNALPYLSADDRELLISQTCGPCFDALFGGP